MKKADIQHQARLVVDGAYKALKRHPTRPAVIEPMHLIRIALERPPKVIRAMLRTLPPAKQGYYREGVMQAANEILKKGGRRKQ